MTKLRVDFRNFAKALRQVIFTAMFV